VGGCLATLPFLEKQTIKKNEQAVNAVAEMKANTLDSHLAPTSWHCRNASISNKTVFNLELDSNSQIATF